MMSEEKNIPPGTASIKSEFLIKDQVKKLDMEYVAPKDKDKLGEEDEPARKKLKGQNKNRPKAVKIPRSEMLCYKMDTEGQCRFGKFCHFSHDVEKFKESKPKDIGEVCYFFETYGLCPFSFSCRFGSRHVINGKNIMNQRFIEVIDRKKMFKNHLNKHLLKMLRKHLYNFNRSTAVFNRLHSAIPDEINHLPKTGSPRKRKKKASPKLDVAPASNKRKRSPDHADEESFSELPEENTELPEEDTGLPEKNIELSEENMELSRENTNLPQDNTNLPQKNANLPEENTELPQKDSKEVKQEMEQQLEVKQEKEEQPDVKQEMEEQLKEKTSSQDVLELSKSESFNADSAQIVPKQEIADTAAFSLPQTLMDGYVHAKFRRQEIKKVDFKGKLYLAPLTTVGNMPFRRVCKRYGADITCGEMAMSSSILDGHIPDWCSMKRHETEDIFGVQLCGYKSEVMIQCAQLLSEKAVIDFIDINMGCPLDNVCKRGGGCGLMNRNKKFVETVLGMSEVINVPLTVKMRTGITGKSKLAHKLINNIRSWGDKVSLITLHGRSKEQRYTKYADWDYINECATVADPIPLFGGGDVLSYEDYYSRMENTNVSGVMIARGALIKPWIFTEIKERRHWDIRSGERMNILQSYVNYGLDVWGSDTSGVENTRRYLLEWLSFLYRYIPVGILEHVPQRINERPPPYYGRDDLETLMASPSCSDWIKISEMLLGPVPDGFNFLPKHKANAYRSEVCSESASG